MSTRPSGSALAHEVRQWPVMRCTRNACTSTTFAALSSDPGSFSFSQSIL